MGPQDRYYASVWQKQRRRFSRCLGHVNIQGKCVPKTKSSQTDEEGWEKLEMVFTVSYTETKFAAVYVFGSGMNESILTV
ncbi:MAG: hypothetical protein R3B93_00700 [Bacteroidia bacterium]